MEKLGKQNKAVVEEFHSDAKNFILITFECIPLAVRLKITY